MHKASETAAPKRNYFVPIILFVVVMTAVALMVGNRFKGKDKQVDALSQKPDTIETRMKTEDVKSLVERVSQLIKINAGEQPTVATVQDADLLRQSNPSFYQDAQNGDRLLVWSDKAVLYSTQNDKLLAVMPIVASQQNTINGQPATPTDTDATSTTSTSATQATSVEGEQAKIQVLNGTTVAGMAKKMSTKLQDMKLTVVNVGDAKLKTYDKTVIIKRATEPMTATLKALADGLNAQVVDARNEETGLTGDVVVIVGADFN